MAVFKYLILFCTFLECRAQAPDGWTRIADQKQFKEGDDGAMLLGEWQSPDEKLQVTVTAFDKEPQLEFLMGLEHLDENNSTHTSGIPTSVKVLTQPRLGLRSQFQKDPSKEGYFTERIMIAGEKKTFLIAANSKEKFIFKFAKWDFGKAKPDPTGEYRQRYKMIAAHLNKGIKEAKEIKIDTRVKPPIQNKNRKSNGPKIAVEIRDDGSYFIEGVKQDENTLALAFAKAHTADKNVRLHIRGHQESVFKHCRKLIRLAAKSGIDEVIFGADK